MVEDDAVEKNNLVQFPLYRPSFSQSRNNGMGSAIVVPMYRLERMTLDDVSRALVGLTNSGPIVLGVRNQPDRERVFDNTYSVQIFKVGEHSPAVSRLQPYCEGDLDKIAVQIKPDVMRFKRKDLDLPISFNIKRSQD